MGKPKKIGLAEVTWPFVVLAVCLDALFVAAYLLTPMSEQMFYTLVAAKFGFLAGILTGAERALRKVS